MHISAKKLKSRVALNIKASKLPKINTVQIVWDNGYHLFYTFNEPIEKRNGSKKCGIDLGEIHSISMASETGESLIISNRLEPSIKRYRNKKLGSFSKAISKCTKGSRKWKKLIKQKL